MKGGFDVFDALLSLSFIYSPGDIGDLADDDLGDLMTSYPVGMRGRLLGGGAIAMLFSMEDATKLASLTLSGEAQVADSLSDEDLATLKEVAESSLGGGVANLSEKFGQDVELEATEVIVAGPEGVDALTAFFDGPATVARFSHSADPHFDATAAFIFSEALESRVPKELLSAVFGEDEDASDPSLADEALVSDDEMKDILSGFTPDVPEPSQPGLAESREAPENLSIILDIELIATARLGKIEMSISDVLNLGPGSIIEVGHLVDEPIELLVNERLIARGDVVVVDEKFGLRITEIISRAERIESLR